MEREETPLHENRQRDREIEEQINRGVGKQRDIEIEGQRNRGIEKQRDREIDQRDREIE